MFYVSPIRYSRILFSIPILFCLICWSLSQQSFILFLVFQLFKVLNCSIKFYLWVRGWVHLFENHLMSLMIEWDDNFFLVLHYVLRMDNGNVSDPSGRSVCDLSPTPQIHYVQALYPFKGTNNDEVSGLVFRNFVTSNSFFPACFKSFIFIFSWDDSFAGGQWY